ncbi:MULTISPECIES: hypothetical protein [Bacillaceae]|uniref:hypothetical protein n=1 Tax=Bacillaceae TaxID=186817 RepID=UPI0006AFE208|nr:MULTISPECIES: hypothetical protein [Bacillaceae]ALC84475.1 hypothetical protein AM499_00550 [Bacillus sp. FJAT-22090]KQL33273.1 hypothetical protein AN959_17035 [Psychrobacillus sp. FJAT-21963]MDF2065176.1 hypothetical protein [Bacillus sp. Cr_A10]
MNNSDVFNLCCRYYGKRVRITCRDGSVHVGEVTRVSRNTVWIRPDDNLGGYGLGFFGEGFGFGFGIALGAITGVVLASAFFW